MKIVEMLIDRDKTKQKMFPSKKQKKMTTFNTVLCDHDNHLRSRKRNLLPSPKLVGELFCPVAFSTQKKWNFNILFDQTFY